MAGLFGLGSLCPQSTLSETDPNLTPSPFPGSDVTSAGGLRDPAADQPASPANTFTFTLNLTQCLKSHGRSFNPGEEQGLDVKGLPPNLPPSTEQTIFFKRT